ncbi:alcohol dehydrogenase catalytic domain-containing protein [Mycolicibacterium goodii]|uniref:Alcohol dehydrogenase-like N-terminal domain-containing protein n=1 Tax=Mycolicibacterium goodii TaxID=134601 RepID=A0A0K0XEH8_MYCGD|nr:hypothetical protein AFA91_32040 [Mycolicibacterium goodii]
MKAVLYEAPKTWSVTDVPTPQPGPGQVRVKVAQVGVCGTDLHIHDGEFGAVFPLIPGHELVGVVDAVGEGVTREDDIVRFHPFDVFRREITIRGSFAEMTSFGAAIDALRGGRVRTDGIITHRFALDDYGRALDALRNDPTVHKVVIAP